MDRLLSALATCNGDKKQGRQRCTLREQQRVAGSIREQVSVVHHAQRAEEHRERG